MIADDLRPGNFGHGDYDVALGRLRPRLTWMAMSGPYEEVLLEALLTVSGKRNSLRVCFGL